MHVHLDPVGGLAGDMFAAALLDAFPALEAVVQRAVRAAGLPERFRCDLVAHADHALTGKRFLVTESTPSAPHHSRPQDHESDHRHHHDHADGQGHRHAPVETSEAVHAIEHAPDREHGHQPFSAIRARLTEAPLDPGARHHAIAIFTALAQAEAEVHGATVDTVTFHEVGEWDSIADIVAAAAIMNALTPATWSIGSLPLGSGFVKSAHGRLPVPAPAATLLMRGLTVHDDGIGGERVTPTGAAIARYLMSLPGRAPRERTLLGTGLGFGTRTLPGLSNCLRVIVFDEAARSISDDQVTVIEFDVDDQTPEDLAIGLEHIRAHDQVLDVLQTSGFGKKGRVVISVRVLCRPSGEDDVAALCFFETTTLGLRFQDIRRHTLARSKDTVHEGGHALERKLARRSDGLTSKVEAESLRDVPGHQQRERLRRAASER